MKHVTVYTQPGCKKCDTLKKWLKSRKVEFEEKLFDTEVQAEMIMRNIFDSPPLLEVSGEVVSSAKIFETDDKVKPSVSELLLSTEGVEK